MSPNPHALAIYLKFVHARGTAPKRFEECQYEDDNVCLHYRTWVPGDGHYRWLRGPINPLSMEHRVDTYLAPSVAFWNFCNCDLFPSSYLLSCNSYEATQVERLILKFESKRLIEVKIKQRCIGITS